MLLRIAHNLKLTVYFWNFPFKNFRTSLTLDNIPQKVKSQIRGDYCNNNIKPTVKVIFLWQNAPRVPFWDARYQKPPFLATGVGAPLVQNRVMAMVRSLGKRVSRLKIKSKNVT
jgi:hypothetical protein